MDKKLSAGLVLEKLTLSLLGLQSLRTAVWRTLLRSAVAHKILVATYHMLSHQVCYHELGDLYLDKLNKHHVTRNLVHRLERLGYTVTLQQKAA